MNTNITTKIESNVSLVNDKFLDEVIKLFKTINVTLTRNDIEELIRQKTYGEIKDLTYGDIMNMTYDELCNERII